MNLWRVAYNAVILPAGRAAARLAALRKPKIADAIAGRKHSFTQIKIHLATLPGSRYKNQGIWFHVSSVGEYLQAVPLMQRLKAAQAGRPIHLSFSSPSVEKPVRSFQDADLAFYLPEDTKANVLRLLDLLNPALLIFSKFDIWPNLVWLASEAGVPVAVTAATLSPDSGRLSQPAGSFHRSFYRDLSLVCAISEEDAASYQKLGVNSSRCPVTGDTRFDQTFERAAGIDGNHPGVAVFNGWKTGVRLVCGSIWPADQEHLLPAIASLAESHPSLKFILVPHEISEPHLEELTAILESHSLACLRYSTLMTEDTGSLPVLDESTRAVIVDRMGVLSAIYRAGDIAYVGGSFSTGVHNVMEPACFGLPVLFGPRHLNSFEARLMIERRGAFPVSSSRDICKTLQPLIENETARKKHGAAARAVVTENLGAVDRTLAALKEHFPEVIGPIEESRR
jgi:3-deoxy-D-manno-octulosonic-acid transferase